MEGQICISLLLYCYYISGYHSKRLHNNGIIMQIFFQLKISSRFAVQKS